MCCLCIQFTHENTSERTILHLVKKHFPGLVACTVKKASYTPAGVTGEKSQKVLAKLDTYKFSVFYAGRKSKMAATAIHRLTLDPYGKIFKCLLLRNYKYD